MLVYTLGAGQVVAGRSKGIYDVLGSLMKIAKQFSLDNNHQDAPPATARAALWEGGQIGSGSSLEEQL
jgi:hypothetical protein